MLFAVGGLLIALGLRVAQRPKTAREETLAPFLVGGGLAILFVALAGALGA